MIVDYNIKDYRGVVLNFIEQDLMLHSISRIVDYLIKKNNGFVVLDNFGNVNAYYVYEIIKDKYFITSVYISNKCKNRINVSKILYREMISHSGYMDVYVIYEKNIKQSKYSDKNGKLDKELIKRKIRWVEAVE